MVYHQAPDPLGIVLRRQRSNQAFDLLSLVLLAIGLGLALSAITAA